MKLLKKLAFAPLFIVCFGFFSYFVLWIINSPYILLSWETRIAAVLAAVAGLLVLSAVSFIIFCTLAQDFFVTIPVALIATICPVVFLPAPLNMVFSAGSIAGFILSNIILRDKLKTYLTFDSSTLLSPPIKNLVTILIVILSFSYYLATNQTIQKEGFKIPDQLIDGVFGAVSAFTSQGLPQVKGVSYLAQMPGISREQVELLKQNPQLLKQYGVDPDVLDSLAADEPSGGSPDVNQLQKQLIQESIPKLLKPYEGIIPALLAVGLFFILQPITSLFMIFLKPLLMAVFWLLEKIGFIAFEKEMREVKKMVV